MRKIVLFALCACFLISPVYCESFKDFQAKQAQNQEVFNKKEAEKKKNYEQEQLKKFKKYKTKKQQEYDAYRRSVNEKFAEMMKKKWTARKKNAAVPVIAWMKTTSSNLSQSTPRRSLLTAKIQTLFRSGRTS